MVTSVDQVRTVLPNAPTSPRAARRFVTDTLRSWALTDLADTVELLTCELVTNVVLHVRGEVSLALRRHDGGVRVEVVDASPMMPRARWATDNGDTESTGRGLVLVEALAADWGVEADPDGKTVWFEVAS